MTHDMTCHRAKYFRSPKTPSLRVIVKNEAGNSSQTQTCDFTKQNKTDNPKECSCLIVKTAEAAANRKIISKGMTTTQLLLITGLVLLIMLVVIDLSCHYMNECGIFSTILRDWGLPLHG